METYVALLRGINVGGRNKLPMQSLSALFAGEACGNVKTYIQSGNVVFKANIKSEDRFVNTISSAIEKEHGFRPAIHLITAKQLQAAIAANPYPDAELEPQSLHVFFLKDLPDNAQINKARELVANTESITVIGHRLYLHAPEGIARSKFANRIDKALQTTTTARNWRTTTKLAELAATLD